MKILTVMQKRKYRSNVRQTEGKPSCVSVTMGMALRRSFCRTFLTAFTAPAKGEQGSGFRSQRRLYHCTKAQYPRQTTAAHCLKSAFR